MLFRSSSAASAASRSPSVPAPAKSASIFRNFSRNWDSIDIGRLSGRLTIEFDETNIRTWARSTCRASISTPFTRRGASDRYRSIHPTRCHGTSLNPMPSSIIAKRPFANRIDPTSVPLTDSPVVAVVGVSSPYGISPCQLGSLRRDPVRLLQRNCHRQKHSPILPRFRTYNLLLRVYQLVVRMKSYRPVRRKRRI